MVDDEDKHACSSPAETHLHEDLPLLEMDPDAAEAMRALLLNPRLRACDARAELIELANDARVAELAVEAAHSAVARNSVERMLIHGLALAHRHTFLIGRQLEAALPRSSSDDAANLRATRLATAMSRVMGAYQQGTTALQRLRSGGQQTVLIQHAEVSEGGQAILAAKMQAGNGGKGAGGRKHRK
jgi:hypothetical protein